jgi:lipopolysaccharide/colanic/teichoic acid biosynthesis glycosyltransferase
MKAKRLFDLALTIPLLIVLAPVLCILSLLVRRYLGSPVFFRQERPGWHSTPFEMTKFRTMTDSRDREGELLPDAERLTRLGRFLRSTSLDELPELINVLKGEMSLVGPRPLLMRYLDRYTPEQARRSETPPGITGWAQVNGRNALSWESKFEHDVYYVTHRNLWFDIKVLFLTLTTVLSREGISSEDSATMPEFMGSSRKKED